MAGFVGLVVIAVVAAALLVGGETDSTTDPDAPTSPGTSPPSSEDRSEAEAAVRDTVEAFAAAEGEQEVCRLFTPEEASSCDSLYETAQPVAYEIGDVELADDQATVSAKQSEFDDPVEFQLLRQGNRWLIDEVDSFTWKNSEDVDAATAVQRFGRREGDYCSLLSRELMQGVGGATGCQQRYPADAPVQYDITMVQTFGIGDTNTGTVGAEASATQSEGYGVDEEAGEWKISSIN